MKAHDSQSICIYLYISFTSIIYFCIDNINCTSFEAGSALLLMMILIMILV